MPNPRLFSLLSGVAIEVDEKYYKADTDLLDKYIKFSSELVRLSLASIGGIGFIIGLLFKDGKMAEINHAQAFVHQ